jgi:hypothetical protein
MATSNRGQQTVALYQGFTVFGDDRDQQLIYKRTQNISAVNFNPDEAEADSRNILENLRRAFL